MSLVTSLTLSIIIQDFFAERIIYHFVYALHCALSYNIKLNMLLYGSTDQYTNKHISLSHLNRIKNTPRKKITSYPAVVAWRQSTRQCSNTADALLRWIESRLRHGTTQWTRYLQTCVISVYNSQHVIGLKCSVLQEQCPAYKKMINQDCKL